MTRTAPLISLCSAMALPEGGGDVPEWIHLLPAGEVCTADGRGPYLVKSLQAIAAGLAPGEKLPIDECHSTDLAATRGDPAPARGWIVELQAREDGLWGKVEWTGEGLRLMADKAYRGISPAVLHDKAMTVLGVLRASLTNTPNLLGLIALHSEGGPSEESGMDWKAKLIELLGLDSAADDAAISAALTAKLEGGDGGNGGGDAAVALNHQLGNQAVVALQSELAGVTTQLNQLRDERSRDQATAFVDAAIAEGRVGCKPLRDDYIALHMANPAQAVKMIAAMPALKGSTAALALAPETDAGGLDAADHQVIALMGLDPEDYRKSLEASGKRKEAL